jgi:hypothetical protein
MYIIVMLVGIVNFNRYGEPDALLGVLRNMGHSAFVIKPESSTEFIEKSSIKHWFFTGSSYDVLSPISPQIHPDIFDIPNKSFFMICYSMESALYNSGFVTQKKPRTNQRIFKINSVSGAMNVWKSHDTYLPVSQNRRLKPIAVYNDEIMTVKYKGAIMTQWHPERTVDGIEMIDDWLKN